MGKPDYRTINLWVGKKEGFNVKTQEVKSGDEVEFQGVELARLSRDGERADTDIQVLYETIDRRLIVHLTEETRNHIVTTACSLCEVTEADLRMDGKYGPLGALCDRFRRPLALDEALEKYGRES